MPIRTIDILWRDIMFKQWLAALGVALVMMGIMPVSAFAQTASAPTASASNHAIAVCMHQAFIDNGSDAQHPLTRRTARHIAIGTAVKIDNRDFTIESGDSLWRLCRDALRTDAEVTALNDQVTAANTAAADHLLMHDEHGAVLRDAQHRPVTVQAYIDQLQAHADQLQQQVNGAWTWNALFAIIGGLGGLAIGFVLFRVLGNRAETPAPAARTTPAPTAPPATPGGPRQAAGLERLDRFAGAHDTAPAAERDAFETP